MTRGCAIEWCQEPHYAKGWCLTHWARNHKYGDPLHPQQAGGRPVSLALKQTSQPQEKLIVRRLLEKQAAQLVRPTVPMHPRIERLLEIHWKRRDLVARQVPNDEFRRLLISDADRAHHGSVSFRKVS